MQVGVASLWRWLRWGSAQHSRYDGTRARVVPAGGQIEWAGLLLVATASVVLFGAVELRFLAPIEIFLFCLAGLALIRRVRRDLPILNLHRAATPLLAILALAVVQLVPLTTPLTYTLSQGMAAVRQGVPGGPAATLPLSVYPYATQLAVLRPAAYTVFFLLKICRCQILPVFCALVDTDKGVELLSRGRLQRAGSALLRRTWDLRSAPASASNVADDADA